MAKQTVIVSVLADTKKFSRAFKNLSREIGLTKLGNGFKSLGSRVGRFVSGAVKGVAGLAGVVAGLALHGGIKRALAIEEAQAALKGLGHDTKSIETIMDSALASVKGTAFGLGDAATIASTAVAAGIKPGEKLTRTLKLTANAAALARTGMTDMGSILNKVWTAGRVQTQELNQLADRGIPIWTKLAEHYGVNATELRKMVSAGKVDAETFATVLEDTVGTAADEMGKTTSGMARNVLAALGRVGEGFISKFLPTVRDAMGGAMQALDNIAPVVADIGEKFGKWIVDKAIPAARRFGKWLTGTLVPALRDVWKVISGSVRGAIKTVTDALKAAGVGAKNTGRDVGNTLVRALKTAGNIIAGLVRAVAAIVKWIIEWRDVLAPIAVAIGTVVAMIVTFNKVMAIAKAVQLAFNVVMAANPIGLIVTAIAALVAGLVYFFTQTETGKKVWKSFTDFLGKAWEWIKNAWATVTAAFDKAWKSIKKGLTDTWKAITTAFRNGYNTVKSWLQKAWDFVKTVWSYTPLGLIVTNWDKILGFFRGIPEKVKGVFSNAIGWLKSAGRAVMTGMREGVIDRWNRLREWFTGIKDRFLGVVRNAGDWLKSAGRAIMEGLWNGLKQKWEDVKGWFSGIGDWIQQNKGPRDYDLRLLRPAGRWILQGLQAGLREELPRLRRTLGTVTTTVAQTPFEANATVNPRKTGGNTYNITVSGVLDGADAGRKIVAAIREYERMNGFAR